MSLPTPVVVRSPNWLGDAIMAFPAVYQLKQLLGSEKLSVACPEKLTELWQLCPFVDQVVSLKQPKSLLECSKQLREYHFETSVLLTNSLRTTVEAKMAGIGETVGFSGHSRSWMLSQVIPKPPVDPEKLHQQHDYLALVKGLGGSDDSVIPSLSLSVSQPEQISLCPGAEFGSAKRWLPERFAAVGRALQEKMKLPVVLLGAPNDRALAEELAKEIPGSINRVGETSLREFAEQLTQSRVVICNDSGAMHLAAVLQVPTVAIFGSTEPRRTGPLGNTVTVLRHHVLCSPCYLRTCSLDFRCMKEITVSEVLEAVTKRVAGIQEFSPRNGQKMRKVNQSLDNL